VIPRAAGLAASAGFAVSVFVGPWFALFRYTPNGWHATLWARVALLFAVANIVLTALALVSAIRVALAALATAAVAIRLIWPPDFGLAFNGLSVPVERRPGVWISFGLAAAALAFTTWRWVLVSRTPVRPAGSSASRS
jgi:fucose permease